MRLVIYGAAAATCTQRVLTTLLEKGVTDYTLNTVNLAAKDHKRPEFLAKQPFGNIPVLEDGDFTLFESRAICFYIASKHADQGLQLLPNPTDIKATAIFQQWASVEKDNFDAFASRIAFEKVSKVRFGLEPDAKLVEHFESGLVPKLDVFDGILAKQEYMAGKDFSLVDIFYLPYAQKLLDAGDGYLIDDRPHLKIWWEKVSGRDSWKKVLAMR